MTGDICLMLLEKERLSVLGCKHVFHERCVDQWFRVKGMFSCPVCRRPSRKLNAIVAAPEPYRRFQIAVKSLRYLCVKYPHKIPKNSGCDHDKSDTRIICRNESRLFDVTAFQTVAELKKMIQDRA